MVLSRALCLLATLAVVFQSSVEAAEVAVGQIVYFDFTKYTSCPPNFAPLDNANKGLIFVGDDGLNAGYYNGKTLFSSISPRAHAHSIPNLGMCLAANISSVSSTYCPASPGTGSKYLLKPINTSSDPLCIEKEDWKTNPSSPVYTHIFYLACVVEEPAGMEMPANGISYMNPLTDRSSAIKECPDGYTNFTEGHGRTIVAVDDSISLSSSHTKVNSVPPLTASTLDFSPHSHVAEITVTISGTVSGNNVCGSNTNYGAPGAYTMIGQMEEASIDFPYRVAKVCKAEIDLTSPVATQLPPDALVFFQNATCPVGWQRETSFMGRLIATVPAGYSNSQVTLAGLTGLNGFVAGGTGPSKHNHLIAQQLSHYIKVPFDETYYYEAGGNGAHNLVGLIPGVGISASNPNSQTEEPDQHEVIPIVGMLLCRKLSTQSPTKSPTASPIEPTMSPTQSPTNSPTQSPTSSPTQSPTNSPTRSPTDSPTRSPTDSPTRSPTNSPTEPTMSPTQSPTNSPTEPTMSPTIPASSDTKTGGGQDSSVAIIVGGAAGGLLFLLLLLCLLWCLLIPCLRRRRRLPPGTEGIVIKDTVAQKDSEISLAIGTRVVLIEDQGRLVNVSDPETKAAGLAPKANIDFTQKAKDDGTLVAGQNADQKV